MCADIKLDMGALDRISQAVRAAALETVGDLRRDVESAHVMPFDTGDMQNNKTFVLQEQIGAEVHTLLSTDGPYARRLYNHPEYNFQTGNNPNAQGEWLTPWLPGGDREKFLPDTFAERLKERMPK